MRLGLINGCSPQHVIVRADLWNKNYRLPKIGTPVEDQNLMEFGKISDIFGPVSKPFFAITPKRSILSSFADLNLVGQPLYTSSSSNKAKRPNSKFIGQKYKKRKSYTKNLLRGSKGAPHKKKVHDSKI